MLRSLMNDFGGAAGRSQVLGTKQNIPVEQLDTLTLFVEMHRSWIAIVRRHGQTCAIVDRWSLSQLEVSLVDLYKIAAPSLLFSCFFSLMSQVYLTL